MTTTTGTTTPTSTTPGATTPSPAPPLLGVSHLALSAPDLPAARRFWTGTMGFEVTTDTPHLLFVVHWPSRVAIAVTDHEATVRGPFDERRTGLDHVALAVPDADALEDWRQRLVADDVPHSAVVDSGAGLHLNLRAPGGVPVELYVMDAATAAAFGLDHPHEGHAHGPAGSTP
ncbi:Catechol 2,3-dioxygenase [Friedmanniella luteola]|uniref:Catechol 2,3-dioxygenase n=1 Tax=Friedmanniella luteola TaxID=546871 RepID=A0A1H1TV03_9ACTN|nr:VOC family protein [Friedmanniella luteola]SDS64030.1 Catechol 2,3-dioxygenase [Friedmanniella luteola]